MRKIPDTTRKQCLAYDQLLVLWKVVLWDLKIQRCWALSGTARYIVMRAVAWTEPAAEIACFTDGDTAKVRAYSYN